MEQTSECDDWKRLQALHVQTESTSLWFLQGNWMWFVFTKNSQFLVIRPGMDDGVVNPQGLYSLLSSLL